MFFQRIVSTGVGKTGLITLAECFETWQQERCWGIELGAHRAGTATGSLSSTGPVVKRKTRL